jgi:hypothetical protein
MQPSYSYQSGVPPQFQPYQTQYPASEIIGWQWWDTQQYPAAGSLALAFFGATQVTLDLSNMEVAGQLAAPKAFLIRGVGMYIKQRTESVNAVAAGNVQTGAFNNVTQIVNTGVLTLTIGSKIYNQIPLWMIPTPGGAFGILQVSNILVGGATASAGTNGWPHAKSFYTLTKPLLIAPQINFRVNLFWPALAAITRATNISIILDGDLFRPVQ